MVIRWTIAVGTLLAAIVCLLPVVVMALSAWGTFPDIFNTFRAIELVLAAAGGGLLVVAMRLIAEARNSIP
ncbi:hypothetical protein DBR17_15900 [Sphingomonas sp. HMWF008]|nr:hypothetical protein DBR17_15900 [Sphingomonas sp. HMWF008]